MYFGLMQILISLKLLFYKPYISPENIARAKRTSLALVGFAGGLYSAFFGVGGGVVAVPLMLMVLHLPIHLAVGNSSALIVVSSFSAVICYIWYGIQGSSPTPFSIGYVNLLVTFLVAPVSMIFARIGVKFATRTSQTKLVKIFAVLLMFVGIKILLNV
ncbi:MAG: sulfite exporter TauE/SafE family protein, partial [Desulfuromusa sp.]|nr:sulfite exporter TauE/SafE family protein [Desulfuromusa sp.]